jgi:hypothetical protein
MLSVLNIQEDMQEVSLLPDEKKLTLDGFGESRSRQGIQTSRVVEKLRREVDIAALKSQCTPRATPEKIPAAGSSKITPLRT